MLHWSENYRQHMHKLLWYQQGELIDYETVQTTFIWDYSDQGLW